jgi:hypothetical protein
VTYSLEQKNAQYCREGAWVPEVPLVQQLWV